MAPVPPPLAPAPASLHANAHGPSRALLAHGWATRAVRLWGAFGSQVKLSMPSCGYSEFVGTCDYERTPGKPQDPANLMNEFRVASAPKPHANKVK